MGLLGTSTDPASIISAVSPASAGVFSSMLPYAEVVIGIAIALLLTRFIVGLVRGRSR